MLKCALIGASGGRARDHAKAYETTHRGQLAAASARNDEALEAFGREQGVGNLYNDWQQMLAKEKPDVVHLVTPPQVRARIIRACADSGVQAVIVEKPVALEAEDYTEMVDLVTDGRVKVAVNHQLQFHPSRQRLERFVKDGGIGEVRFVDASCGLNPIHQGTHILQMLHAFVGDAEPNAAFGQISGIGMLDQPDSRHPAPDALVGELSFDTHARALVHFGPGAPTVKPNAPDWAHKRIVVYGSRGMVDWTMWHWRYESMDRGVDGDSHDYRRQDATAQAAFTEAVFDWVEDDRIGHPCDLNSALEEFNWLLGLYQSAVYRCIVPLPVAPEPQLLEAMRLELAAGSRG